MTFENYIGLIVLLYGVMKVSLCILKTLPKEYDDKITLIKHDRTTAGYVLDAILFIFGVYAILHGLRLLQHLHPSHVEILNNVHITTALYTLVGVFMIVFYYFVLYTDIPITKDDKEHNTYEVLGLGGGFMFLFSICCLLAWHVYHDNVKIPLLRKSHSFMFLTILALILSYINGLFIYKYVYTNQDNAKVAAVDLLMMPLASIS